MPWSVAQRVLAECEIHRSMGWDRTIEQITSDDFDYAQKVEQLTDALREHILCGEKASTFFSLGTHEMNQLRSVVSGLSVDGNAFQKKYPLALPEANLVKQPLGGQLTAIEKRENGIGVVFCSPRLLTSREALQANDFPDGAEEVFERFDEVVGMKTHRFHAFDVVWIPNEGNLVDVRVDFPDGMHVDQSVAALNDTIEKFNFLVGADVLASKVNLFPLIKKIYLSPKEGNVVELGFGTSTASLKLEKMRRRGLCLRQETYHKGGSTALGTPIEPHRIGIVWRLPIGEKLFSTPELSLFSNSRTAASENPELYAAFIQKCVGIDDYRFVRERIEHHLMM